MQVSSGKVGALLALLLGAAAPAGADEKSDSSTTPAPTGEVKGMVTLPGGKPLPPPVLKPLVAPPRRTIKPTPGGAYTGPDLTPYLVLLLGLLVLALLVYVVVNRVRSIPQPVEEPELAPGEALMAAIDSATADRIAA